MPFLAFPFPVLDKRLLPPASIKMNYRG